MGIFNSIIRFLGRETEDEEAERPIYPYSSLHRRHKSSRSSSGSLLQILNFHSLIYKSIKGLFQKLRFIFYLPRPRNSSDPILPIQIPAPSTANDPLLVQTLVISSPSDDYSSSDSTPESEHTTFALFSDLNNTDDQELQSGNVDASGSTAFALFSDLNNTDDQELESENVDVSGPTAFSLLADINNADDIQELQQWPEENYSSNRMNPDSVVISIPDFTYSLSHTSVCEEIVKSTVVIEEISPQNVPFSSLEEREDEVREEEKVVIKSEVRWIKHYSSSHRILLVGEGDFSFSACLAVAFVFAPNMIATSLNSKAFLKKNYENAGSNIEELRNRGSKVMHGIDATKMANHALLGQLTFDRIIFNFPFAGFFKNLSREAQLRRHRRLVSLFMKNAKEMISGDGEIHISHKTNDFHIEWNLESIASSHGLRLVEDVKFNHLDYPGYNTKCGFGGDNNFNCNPSKTYKFGVKKVC